MPAKDEVKPPYGVRRNRGASGKPTTYYYKEKPAYTPNEFFMKELLDSEKYAEQRETFKRLAKVNKGGTDTSQPDTYHLAPALSVNKKLKAS